MDYLFDPHVHQNWFRSHVNDGGFLHECQDSEIPRRW